MFSCTSVEPVRGGGSGCLCRHPDMLALARRIDADLTRRGFVAGVGASIAALGLSIAPALKARPSRLARSSLQISVCSTARRPRFGTGSAPHGRGRPDRDGRTGKTRARRRARSVVDCGGRVVMPGLIDAHWHSRVRCACRSRALFAADVGYIFLAASGEAERTLMRGFTTIRDLGGPSFPLKQAIDEGLVPGPRIFPCGAMITTSGGHGDLRPLQDIPRSPGGPLSSHGARPAAAMIADSADEVRLRVREQTPAGRLADQARRRRRRFVAAQRRWTCRRSASRRTPRGRSRPPRDWNTYVAVARLCRRRPSSARSPQGAQCVEHAHLMDEATAKLMAEKGVWLSIQPFLSEEDTGPLSGQSRINGLQVFRGNGNGLPAGEGAQDQDRLRFGSPVFERARRAPGDDADPL